MRYLKDFSVFGLLVISLFNMINTSIQIPLEQQVEESKEVKFCLLECMACKELWGGNYDGHACASGCFLTEGRSIDQDCRLGTNMPKRYTDLKSTDQCKKQCEICTMKYSSRNYDKSKCLETCDQVLGKERDETCNKFLSLYKIK
ncbi:uncharacterized protein LOC132742309 [Ruditapes philippinarum]|uniref:uncharacterized protein LOC132742309 n=1 Tax=Ruditapes philippinarum TaxID=129788 RepID=UPI00295B3B86|nr:uncharacterized protein LOC132742309 [Ruditapes philippinarum]